ncbi:MAG: hypothetical protein HXY43_13520 [Fischerella sp.]|jgi:hypothetical protein|uniref:hypothetical protein n=1 Tax=Fischerella sp. TaxID=1191 RepID=UPI0018296470|nr:hypothetical protein [Fischerella sp.]NWF60245.1 hypothetical protein [Fischerella sp.]
MLDFNTLAEFSRANCISICTFLVPANLVATLLTITFAVLRCPPQQVWPASGAACMFALMMVLHVYTWFMIGVVMVPTYVLLSLAITCLIGNLGAILFHTRHFPTPSFGK